MKPLPIDNDEIVLACLKQKLRSSEALEQFLRGEGIEESLIPEIIRKATTIDCRRKSAKRKIYEGIFISGIGCLGITHSYNKKVDGAVWVIWSAIGLGILAIGLAKKQKINKFK